MAYPNYSKGWKLDRRYKGDSELASDIGFVKGLFKVLFYPFKLLFKLILLPFKLILLPFKLLFKH